MATMRALILVVVVVSLISIGSASKGKATFYTELLRSACFGMKKEGVMIAAASKALWRGGAACGTMLRVKCTGPGSEGIPHPCRGSRSILVKIVDFCPGCHGKSIDLSQQAFSKIADPDAGIIAIDFHQV